MSAAEMSVQVCLHVRPLLGLETSQGCGETVDASEVERTVALPRGGESVKRFTFDHVIAPSSTSDETATGRLYKACVEPLVEGCLEGLNATVLAYGQTGSGKTHTMSEGPESVIPRVAKDLFERLRVAQEPENSGEYKVQVSFFEIYREELLDLLGGGETSLSIRESSDHNVYVAGLKLVDVANEAELLGQLAAGCTNRATGSTEMNKTSSRSHAVFTIQVRHNNTIKGLARTAKFHLVDLAGSERAKRTKAAGERLKEGIDINKGLLALGNVISALGDESRRVPAAHIPYRDSKLTRILQDSLGGNSRTLMIACVSPADVNFEETMNTIKYANRTRNIKNKPMANDEALSPAHAAPLIQELRNKVASLQTQLAKVQTSGLDRPIDAKRFQRKTRETSQVIVSLSERNMKLENQLVGLQTKLKDRIASISKDQGADVVAIASLLEQDLEAIYAEEQIDKSEPKPRHLNSKANRSSTSSDGSIQSSTSQQSEMEDSETQEAELDHLERQVALQRELQSVNDCIEAKLKSVEELEKSETGLNAFESTIHDLCKQLEIVEMDRDDLRKQLKSGPTQHNKPGQNEKMKEKLAALETKYKELSQTRAEQEKLARQQKQRLVRDSRGLEKLKTEITDLKHAKVKLTRRLKEESDGFRRWKKDKEREVKQLESQQMRQRYKYSVLERQHEKQQKVLHRKQEEAVMAHKRLKELLQKQRQAKISRPNATSSLPSDKTSSEWIGSEADTVVAVRMAKRASRAQAARRTEIAAQLSSGEITSEEADNQMRDCSNLIASLNAESSDAIDDSKSSVRWRHVQNLHHAKQLLKIMFCLLIQAKVETETSELALSRLREDNDDLQALFLQAERDQAVQLATMQRHYEDLLDNKLVNSNAHLDEQVRARLDSLQAENEQLLHDLANAKPAKKKAKTTKTKPLSEDEYDDLDFLITDDEEEETEDDEDDDYIPEESRSKRQSKGSRRSSEGGKRKVSSGEASIPDADAMATYALMAKQLPEDLERIEVFKVEELKNALYHFGLSISGRKEALKARLMQGLIDKQSEKEADADVNLLPKTIPDRRTLEQSKPKVTESEAPVDAVQSKTLMERITQANKAENEPTVSHQQKNEKVGLNGHKRVVSKPTLSDHRILSSIPTSRPRVPEAKSRSDDNKENSKLSISQRLQVFREQKNAEKLSRSNTTMKKAPLGVVNRN
eukprot:CAMPEP_0184554888 /NCGR_PEP_ID=MMETSP0199_2-20130426/36238_1 /TAXON_ID=1112570 /ORGANISM="Thraustochytrium sp., Strain LLF1b" /LENGTH=1198 /DNA_ID=CAMNT_0026951077 /DNA_START=241 /DNA_END=3837 /DNA_ORIENTATION=+